MKLYHILFTGLDEYINYFNTKRTVKIFKDNKSLNDA